MSPDGRSHHRRNANHGFVSHPEDQVLVTEEKDMADIEIVLEMAAVIGESPTWSPTEAALYWIDVKRPALYRFDPVRRQQRTWPMPADIGAFALTAGLTGAVVALRTGIFALDLASGSLDLLAPPPFDPALHRFNEGSCDDTGRFWVGVMFDPVRGGAAPPQRAALHSFTLADGLRPEPDLAELHNGMAWSADGRYFHLAHSQTGEIHRYRLDAQGRLSDRQLFATIPASLGLPDGAAIDSDGGYWCAIHGGGRLRRFSADGRFDRDIALPVSQPTMCAFGGPHLDELYVTSASDQLGASQREREPHAGTLLRLRPGVKGIARRCTVR